MNLIRLGELVEERYMVPPNDPKMLAERIVEMIDHPEQAKAAMDRNVRLAGDYCADILGRRRTECCSMLRDVTRDWLRSQHHQG